MALQLSARPAFVEPDWRSWSAFTAALNDPQLGLGPVRNDIRGIGHFVGTRDETPGSNERSSRLGFPGDMVQTVEKLAILAAGKRAGATN